MTFQVLDAVQDRMPLASIGTKLALKEMIAFAKRLASPPNLDAATITHVLEELPRLAQRFEARIHDIEASGCSLLEAQILVVQTIDAQRRTIDPEKRARLVDALVNGFCTKEWTRVKHSLLVRMAFELEPEHVDILNAKTRTHQPTGSSVPDDIRMALESELVSRGLLRIVSGGHDRDLEHDRDTFSGARRVAAITSLGLAFLEALAD